MQSVDNHLRALLKQHSYQEAKLATIRGYQQLELLMLKLASPQQRSLVRFSLNKPLSSDFDLNKQLPIEAAAYLN